MAQHLQDEVSALDALGQLMSSRRGAELVLGSDQALSSAMTERALGRSEFPRTSPLIFHCGAGLWSDVLA